MWYDNSLRGSSVILLKNGKQNERVEVQLKETNFWKKRVRRNSTTSRRIEVVEEKSLKRQYFENVQDIGENDLVLWFLKAKQSPARAHIFFDMKLYQIT